MKSDKLDATNSRVSDAKLISQSSLMKKMILLSHFSHDIHLNINVSICVVITIFHAKINDVLHRKREINRLNNAWSK